MLYRHRFTASWQTASDTIILQVTMVYFVCSTCGTCLKKNQVTTHWYKCRQGKHVSCMDCGKDFWWVKIGLRSKIILDRTLIRSVTNIPQRMLTTKKPTYVIDIWEKLSLDISWYTGIKTNKYGKFRNKTLPKTVSHIYVLFAVTFIVYMVYFNTNMCTDISETLCQY